MIGIKVGNEWLTLPVGTRISFDLVNPIFSDDLGYNSYSLSFPIPVEGNSHKLAYADIVSSSSNTRSFSCTVYLEGIPWKSATLEVKEAGSYDVYQCNILIENAAIADILSGQNLKDFTYDGVRTISLNTAATRAADLVSHANGTVSGTIATDDYVFFPVKDSDFYNGKHPAQDGSAPGFNDPQLVNYYEASTFRGNYSPYLFTSNHYNEYFLVPYFYLFYVLGKLFSENGYTLDDTEGIASDSELKTLTIYNNYSLDEGYVQAVTLFSSTLYVNVNQYAGTIDPTNHVPDVAAGEFLRGILDLFNAALIVTGTGVKLIAKKDVLNGTESVDWSSKSIRGYRLMFEDIRGCTLFSDLDADDELTTEEEYIRETDNFTIAGEVNSYLSLPGSANSEDLYYVKNENSYYKYTLDEQQASETYSWQFFGYRRFPITFGDGEKEVTSKVSTTEMISDDWWGGYSWRIPYVKQVGSSSMYDLGKNPFSPRLLFYRGLQTPSPSAGSYPQGAADDGAGFYNYSLFWDGDYGLYEVWWKDWLEALENAKVLKMRFMLNITDILTLDWTKRVEIRTREGIVKGLIRRLSVDIGSEGMGLVTAEIVKI